MVFRVHVSVVMLPRANVHFRGHKQSNTSLVLSTLAVDINRPFRQKSFTFVSFYSVLPWLSRLSLRLDTIFLPHFVIRSLCVNEFAFTLPVLVFLANTI